MVSFPLPGAFNLAHHQKKTLISFTHLGFVLLYYKTFPASTAPNLAVQFYAYLQILNPHLCFKNIIFSYSISAFHCFLKKWGVKFWFHRSVILQYYSLPFSSFIKVID